MNRKPDDLRQELDADAAALSKIPADPLQPDPLGFLFKPIDDLSDRPGKSERLKLGATFLNQYATTTPASIRHNQPSGRLDFSGVWVAYDHESTAGSISVLVRSGTNIGISQQFNLSDSLDILYWLQDLLNKRLSFYVGKIHPNQYVSLSMFNNNAG